MSALTDDDVTQLAKKLTAANPKQLAKIRAQVNGLLDLQGDVTTKAVHAAPSDDWLFDGIVQELVARGLLHAGAVKSLKTSANYKAYAKRAAGVRELLLQSAPGLEGGYTGRLALARQVASCLADDLSERNTLTPGLLLASIERAMGAVDAAFPGYMASGLLAKVVRFKNTG